MVKFFLDIWYFRYTVRESWPKAIESAWWVSRLGMAVHVLIGRPIAYRIKMEDGVMILADKSIVQDCIFLNSPREGIRVELRDESVGMGG